MVVRSGRRRLAGTAGFGAINGHNRSGIDPPGKSSGCNGTITAFFINWLATIPGFSGRHYIPRFLNSAKMLKTRQNVQWRTLHINSLHLQSVRNCSNISDISEIRYCLNFGLSRVLCVISTGIKCSSSRRKTFPSMISGKRFSIRSSFC